MHSIFYKKKTNQIQPKESPTFKPYCVGAQCPVHDTTENISANTFFFFIYLPVISHYMEHITKRNGDHFLTEYIRFMLWIGATNGQIDERLFEKRIENKI